MLIWYFIYTLTDATADLPSDTYPQVLSRTCQQAWNWFINPHTLFRTCIWAT